MPPFVEDMEEMMNEPPMTNIGTDLFDNFANFDDDEEPLDSGPILPDIMKEELAQTVVSIEDEMNGNSHDSDDDNEDGADEDLENGHAAEAAVDVPTPAKSKKAASAKKAGRPPKGASRVSIPAKTPNSAKTKAAGGRKRKVEEGAEEPVAKRPSHGRATAAAAMEGIKEASKKRPRAAPGTVKKEAPKSGRGRPGRKPKVEQDGPAAEEYEIEDILDSGMDHDTKQVLFLVKWKGYGDEANTWEPKTNLTHAKELVKEFETAKKKEEKAEKAAKKGTTAAKKPAPAKPAPRKAAAKAPVKKTAAKAAPGRPGRPGRRGRPKKT
ncbi:hypothetical protein KVR01_006630 [Diaporthe batatas]|uniref:uncharacterized protein n=1 Tax=Diaporthe batatas TaxID=748121 RepID=UPI001D046259|nr:uncharacterized protein KVR01_006630 [Diaporthe batatas]KAG8163333.1 hypothetical protein KVR01_006630 [Diaporthe batatas]